MSDEPKLLNMEFPRLEHGQAGLLTFTPQGVTFKVVTMPKPEPEVVQANFYQGINRHSSPRR